MYYTDKTQQAFENISEMYKTWAAGECFLHFSSSRMPKVFHHCDSAIHGLASLFALL